MNRFHCAFLHLAMALLVVGCAAVASASSYSDAVIALGPDAYYRGDEVAGPPIDTSSNGHDLDDFFNNTFGAAGPRPSDGFLGMDGGNNAYQFTGPQVARSGEGVSQYTPALGQDPRTVIAWVNLDTRGSADLGGAHNIWGWGLDFGGPNTFTGWNLFIDEAFVPSTGTGSGVQNAHLHIQGRQIAAIDSPVNIGQWHMIAIGFEGDGTAPLGDAMIWIDGALQTNLVQDTNAVSNTGGTDNPSLGFRLGQAVGGFGANARIDHVSVHTEKLSGATIENLYDIAVVPEPSTAMLASFAGIGLLTLARRRRRVPV